MSKASKFKELFKLIDKAGGPNLPKAKALSFNEKLKATFNIWGFLFGIFYYLYHGMWKKGLTLVLIAFVLTFILLLIAPSFQNMSWVVSSAIFATRANPDLYKKYKQKKDGWI